MSYTIDLIVTPLSDNNEIAWREIESLRKTYYDDQSEIAPAFISLHSSLTARYPCLCSYADDDPKMEESPWADGPLINNFSHKMGMLAIVFSKVGEVIPFIIKEANTLGIIVADGQSGEIFRPNQTVKNKQKPWWKLWK